MHTSPRQPAEAVASAKARAKPGSLSAVSLLGLVAAFLFFKSMDSARRVLLKNYGEDTRELSLRISMQIASSARECGRWRTSKSVPAFCCEAYLAVARNNWQKATRDKWRAREHRKPLCSHMCVGVANSPQRSQR